MQKAVVSIARPSYAGIFDVTITRRANGYSTTKSGGLTTVLQSTNPTIVKDATSCVAYPYKWDPHTGPVTFQIKVEADAEIKVSIRRIDGYLLWETVANVTAGYNKIVWDGIMSIKDSGHMVGNGMVLVVITNNRTGQVLAKFPQLIQYQPR